MCKKKEKKDVYAISQFVKYIEPCGRCAEMKPDFYYYYY